MPNKDIDEKVVSMRFDNKKFEQNVDQSIKSIDKLEKSLKLKGINEGFDNLEKSASKVNLTPLANSVQAVGKKFTAMEVVAITALQRLANSVISSASSIVKQMTGIATASAGWDKYADKTTAVQTIMAATASQFKDSGKQMEYVNEQLDKLNWFTDETSYNFVDMVGNIGKFTSSGVNLETSVTAMQGIATWAAISGQNAQTASRAMYNLAQSLGAGSVKLQDWMSIENANMATVEFKQTAMDAAVAMGQLKKSADGTYKTLKGNAVTVENFRMTLSDAWLTSDVLMKTLDKYGNATNRLYEISEETGLTATDLLKAVEDFGKGAFDASDYMDDASVSAERLEELIEDLSSEEYAFGIKALRAAQEAKTFAEAIDSIKDAASTVWMNIWETIFGDYEEARVLWTKFANFLYDIFVEPLNTIQETLERWKDLGLFKQLFAAVEKIGPFLDTILSPVKEALNEVFHFNNLSVNLYKKITAFIFNFSKKIDEITDKFQNGKAEKVKQFFVSLFKVIKAFNNVIKSLWNKILKPIIKTVFNSVKDVINEFGGLNKLFDSFSGTLNGIAGSLTIDEKFLTSLSKVIKFTVKVIAAAIYGLQNLYSKVLKPVISWIVDIFEKKVIPILTKLSEKVVTPLKEKLENISFENFNLSELFNFKDLKLPEIKDFSSFIDAFSLIVNKLLEFGVSKIPFLKTIIEAIFKILEFVFIQIGYVVSLISIGDIASLLKKVILFGLIFSAVSVFVSFVSIINSIKNIFKSVYYLIDELSDVAKALKTRIMMSTFVAFIASVAIMVGSLYVLSKIGFDKIWKSLIILASIMGLLAGTMILINKLCKSVKAQNIKMLKTIGIVMATMGVILVIMSKYGDIKKMALSAVILGSLILEIAGIVIGLNYLAQNVNTKSIKVIKTLGSTMVSLGLVLVIMSRFGDVETIRGMATILASLIFDIALVVVGLNYLARNVNNKMAKVVSTFGSIMVSVGLVLVIMSKFGDVETIRGMATILASLIFDIGIVVIGLNYLAKNVNTKMVKVLATLGSVMVSLGLILTIMSRYGNEDTIVKMAIILGSLVLELASIMVGLNYLAKNVNTKMVKVLATLGSVMVSLGFILTIMSRYGNEETIVKMAIILGSLVLELAGIVVGLNYLAKDVSAKTVKVLKTLGSVMVSLGFILTVMSKFGDADKMVKMAIVLGALILEVAGIAAGLSFLDKKNKISNSVIKTLLAISACLVLVSSAVAILSLIKNTSDTVKKVLAVSVLLIAMTGITILLSKFVGNNWLAGALSMASLAAVLYIIILAFIKLKEIDIESLNEVLPSILKIIGLISAIMIVVGLLGAIGGQGVAVGMIAFSASLLLLAVAILSIAGALALCADAMDKFLSISPEKFENIDIAVQALTVALKGMIMAITQGIVDAIAYLAENAPEIADNLFTLASTIVSRLGELAMQIAEIVINLIDKVLSLLADHSESIANSVLQILIGALKAIRDNIFEVVTLVGDIIVEVINALYDAVPRICDAAFNGFISVINYLADTLPEKTEVLRDALFNLIKAVFESLLILLGIKNSDGREGPIAQFGMQIINNIKAAIVSGWDSIKTWFSKIGDKIKDAVSGAWESIKEVGATIIDKIQFGLGSLGDVGKNIIMGIINGMKNIGEWLWNKICEVGGEILDFFKKFFGIQSPSKLMEKEIGRYLPMGIAEGMVKETPVLEDAAKENSEAITETYEEELGSQAEGIGTKFVDKISDTISNATNGKVDLTGMSKSVKKFITDKVSLFDDMNSLNEIELTTTVVVDDEEAKEELSSLSTTMDSVGSPKKIKIDSSNTAASAASAAYSMNAAISNENQQSAANNKLIKALEYLAKVTEDNTAATEESTEQSQQIVYNGQSRGSSPNALEILNNIVNRKEHVWE